MTNFYGKEGERKRERERDVFIPWEREATNNTHQCKYSFRLGSLGLGASGSTMTCNNELMYHMYWRVDK